MTDARWRSACLPIAIAGRGLREFLKLKGALPSLACETFGKLTSCRRLIEAPPTRTPTGWTHF
jgi:hypothetical protein